MYCIGGHSVTHWGTQCITLGGTVYHIGGHSVSHWDRISSSPCPEYSSANEVGKLP